MTRVFATMVLALSAVGTVLAAGGTYDDEDPFHERERIARFEQAGGDLSQEVELEFQIDFEDRPETREPHATRFAAKLRRLGYPKATAQPCGRADRCWFVTAPKRMRVDEKKLIALSKELDQLAADDYGRYRGWDTVQFRREEEQIRSATAARNSVPTAGRLLLAFEQLATMQCDQRRSDMERSAAEASAAGKLHEASEILRTRDLICTCMPERARQLRTEMPKDERDTPITEEEFTQRYTPAIVNPCAAGAARRMYGEDCGKLSKPANAGEGYCSCMHGLVTSMSDAELAQMGLDTADWAPRAAAAKKAGQGEPEKPPMLRQFMEKESACRK
jgi:hypothetical protein